MKTAKYVKFHPSLPKTIVKAANLYALRFPGRLAEIDDEREFEGNAPYWIYTAAGWRFDDEGLHTWTATTAKDAVKALGLISPCHCDECVATLAATAVEEKLDAAIAERREKLVAALRDPAAAGIEAAKRDARQPASIECTGCGIVFPSARADWLDGDPLGVTSDGGDGEEHPYCPICAEKAFKLSTARIRKS